MHIFRTLKPFIASFITQALFPSSFQLHIGDTDWSYLVIIQIKNNSLGLKLTGLWCPEADRGLSLWWALRMLLG